MQAERAPEAVALTCAGESLTYSEINARANRLARRLRAMGVGPEVLVGLCVGRSADMVVGLLAVLKAGGAYVPLDPAYPAERLAFMLDDARASVLLTEEKLRGDLPDCEARVVCLDSERAAIDARERRQSRRRTGRGEPRLRHLHLGLDRQAQRGSGHPRRARQPARGDARASCDQRAGRAPGGDDALVRHRRARDLPAA